MERPRFIKHGMTAPKKALALQTPGKAVKIQNRPDVVKKLAAQTFERWQRSVREKNSDLSGLVGETYADAVANGYRGHMGTWEDAVLAAGNMSRDDFEDAPGQGPKRRSQR